MRKITWFGGGAGSKAPEPVLETVKLRLRNGTTVEVSPFRAFALLEKGEAAVQAQEHVVLKAVLIAGEERERRIFARLDRVGAIIFGGKRGPVVPARRKFGGEL